MSLKVSTLIVAPHIDDELIGCWSVLNDSTLQVYVLYLEELTEFRKAEAMLCAQRFGFHPLFADCSSTLQLVEEAAATNRYDRVYVPSRKDWHAAHKRANAAWRQHATHFYSVDMADGRLLSDAAAKNLALDEIYPGQSDLWRFNQKYWLFEDIKAADYEVYKKLSWHFADGVVFSITCLEKYAPMVNSWYSTYPSLAARNADRRKTTNKILSMCPTGKVTIEYGNERIEA